MGFAQSALFCDVRRSYPYSKDGFLCVEAAETVLCLANG